MLREQLKFVTFERFTTADKAWPVSGQVICSGASCAAPNGYLHPAYPSTWGRAADTGTDPYDTSRPITDGSSDRCGAISRI